MYDQENKDSSGKTINPRRPAKRVLQEQIIDVQALSPEEIHALIYELQFHKFELEIQNEELQATQRELEETRDKYVALYNCAPIGYFTIDKKGLILEVNLTGAKLLGLERSQLIEKPLSRFIAKNSRGQFDLYHKQVSKTQVQQTCELELVRNDGTLFYAQLGSIAVQDNRGDFSQFHVMVLDITEHKQVEEALQLGEVRYVLATSAGQSGVWDWDIETNEIYVDPNLKAILGYADHQVRNHLDDWNKLIHPDDMEQMTAAMQAHLDGVTAQYEAECRMLHKDGTIRWVLARGVAIQDIHGKPYRVMGTSTDVTERKQMNQTLQKMYDELEQRVEKRTVELVTTNAALRQEIAERKRAEVALRGSEQRYKLLLDSVTDYIYTVQIKDERPVATFHNPACVAVTGYTSQEYKTDPYLWYRMIHAQDREAVAKQVAEALLGEIIPPLEHRLIHKDGSLRWVRNTIVPRHDEEGHLVAYDGLITDISERKRAEEELTKTAQRFRALIENMSDIIINLDSDGFIRYLSPSVVRVLGYRSEEIIGKRVIKFIHPDDLPDATGIFVQDLAKPGDTVSIELRVKHNDGSWRILEGIGKNLLDNPTVAGIVVNARDITKRKQLEERLEAIYQLGQELTLLHDESTIIRRVLETATNVLQFEIVVCGLVDEVAGELQYKDGIPEITAPSLPLYDDETRGIGVTVVHSGQAINVPDTAQDSRYVPLLGRVSRSELCVPLRINQQVIGVLNVESTKPHYFTSADQQLLQTLADQTAVALENAQLHAETERRVQQLAVLHGLDQAIISSLRLDDVYRAFSRHTARLLPYDRMSIALLEEGEIRLAYVNIGGKTRLTTDITLSRENPVAGWVIAKRQPLLRNNIVNDTRFAVDKQLAAEGIHSDMSIPLQIKGQIVGTWNIGSRQVGAYSPDDLEVAQSVADQLAIAIENARLYAQAKQEIVERKRAEEALRHAYDEVEMRVLARTVELAQTNSNLKKEIAERKRAEIALQQSRARYQAIVEDQTELICRFQFDGTLTFVNEAYCRYFDKKREELIGHSFMSSIPEEDLEIVHQQFSSLSLDNPMVTYEHRVITPKGEVRWQQWADRMIFDAQGHLMEIQSVGRDITERKIATEQLEYTALHDALTDLPNRTLFTDRLGQAIERAKQRDDYLFAVLFIDLDRFKNINDSLGHLVGDQLLVTIARRLEECVRPIDMVARLGGDEFIILLDNIRDIGQVKGVAGRIQDELAIPINLGGHQVFTTASIGITIGTQEYERPEDLLRDADTAMYQAKTHGKARYELFKTDQHIQVVDRWQLEIDLWQAVEREEFRIHYQPIVSLDSGQIVGVEALLRWQHPQRGLIGPAEFIPLAEETGLIIPLGEWLLRTACTQAQVWHKAGYTHLWVAINMSARQLQQQNVVSLIKDVLTETGLTAQNLELEITEGIATQNIDFAILEELRAIGLKISIDDFGIGSSLECLKRFPLNTLKIDQSFVKNITIGVKDKAIITTIIAMAHNLNLKVIAEGVETEEQLAFLQAQQCDEVQGYLFSRPLLGEDLAELLLTGWCLY